MSMSSAQLARCLQDIQDERTALIQELITAGPLLVGYVYDVMRKCGNPSCHCAHKPGHRQTLLIYSRNGRRSCKLVRRQEEQRIKQAWNNYRDFKKGIRRIRTLNRKELQILGAKLKREALRYK